MAPDLPCSRCGAPTPPLVHADTGGLCRACQKRVPDPVTIADLTIILRAKDARYRCSYFAAFSRQRKPSPDAIPILREALQVGDPFLSKFAAAMLGKIGPGAAAAVSELLDAAATVDPSGMPQAYPECLTALVAIDKHRPEILPLIRRFKHICNWVPISAAFKACAKIGTPEAVDLLEEIKTFWSPEFNRTQQRVAERLLSDARKALST